ncbi:hypothetical protein AKO1_005996 [Acrasis kona]|uniref:DH domain-containing protein n=1 Tax=Acrasis kona TaxID=1008807 RepID=A0AAW2YHS7_9EUKA
MKDVYETPLQQTIAQGLKLITEQQLDDIFSHLEPIRNIHISLLDELEKHVIQTETLGKKIDTTLGAIFLKNAPKFLCYTDYCNKFGHKAQLLRDLKANNKDLDKWLSLQKKRNKDAENNSLDSFLIMPVQRLPRYNLLIQELLKKTTQHHRDFSDLTKALEVMKETNEMVNKMILLYNNRKKMEHYSTLISTTGCPKDFDLLDSSDRKFLSEEPNVKIGSILSDQVTITIMCIFTDCVVFLKSIPVENASPTARAGTNKKNKIKGLITIALDLNFGQQQEEQEEKDVEPIKYETVYHTHILFNGPQMPWMKETESNESDFSFDVVTVKNIFTFYAPNLDKKAEWIKTFVDSLERFTKAHPSTKKERPNIHAKSHYENMAPKQEFLSIANQPSSPMKRSGLSFRNATPTSPAAALSPASPKTPSRSLRDLLFSNHADEDDDKNEANVSSPHLISYRSHAIVAKSHYPKRNMESCPTFNKMDYTFDTDSINDKIIILAMSTCTDPQLSPDELHYHKGDLMIVMHKCDKHYHLVKKVGLNCEPERKQELLASHIPVDYESLKKIYKSQKSKRVNVVAHETRAQKTLRRINSHYLNISQSEFMSGVETQYLFDSYLTNNGNHSSPSTPTNALVNEQPPSPSPPLCDEIERDVEVLPMPIIQEPAFHQLKKKRISLSSIFQEARIKRTKSAEAMKKSSPSPVAQEHLHASQSFGVYDGESEKKMFDHMINVMSDKDQYGYVPNRFFVQITTPSTISKIHRLLEWRNEMEEKKIRNFKLPKRNSVQRLNSLNYRVSDPTSVSLMNDNLFRSNSGGGTSVVERIELINANAISTDKALSPRASSLVASSLPKKTTLRRLSDALRRRNVQK